MNLTLCIRTKIYLAGMLKKLEDHHLRGLTGCHCGIALSTTVTLCDILLVANFHRKQRIGSSKLITRAPTGTYLYDVNTTACSVII